MSVQGDGSLPSTAGALVAVLHECGVPDLEALGVLLHQRSRAPQCYVTVVGETSVGKSTLVNALIGREVLPAFARPTTATVTHVVCKKDGDEHSFAIYRDA